MKLHRMKCCPSNHVMSSNHCAFERQQLRRTDKQTDRQRGATLNAAP